MRLAVPLAIEGYLLLSDPATTENADVIGPLMTNDIPFAVIERFGVFWVQTGSVLQRTIDDDHDFPGQSIDPLEHLGKLPGLGFGETLQRRNRYLGMRLQHF